MRTSTSAVIILYGKLLIVRKKDSWILPGGKPKNMESDIDCLQRESAEELNGTLLKDFFYYREFEGKTPHRGDVLNNKVYFAQIDGIFRGVSTRDSIVGYSWINRDKACKYSLSDITSKIIESLIKDRHI